MTPHISALKEDIAKTVIMPGDPLRAKFIAENYLKDYKVINEVRGMYGYTGIYKGKRVTIMASGMGIPSMGIYSYELYKYYDVDNIIRIGSCGSYDENINIYDVILVDKAYSKSTYAKEQNGFEGDLIEADNSLNNIIRESASIKLIEGIVNCSEVFYKEKEDFNILNKECIAVEMESFALFHNAKVLNKKAACLLTVVDSLVTNEKISSEEREKSLVKMIEIAFNSIT